MVVLEEMVNEIWFTHGFLLPVLIVFLMDAGIEISTGFPYVDDITVWAVELIDTGFELVWGMVLTISEEFVKIGVSVKRDIVFIVGNKTFNFIRNGGKKWEFEKSTGNIDFGWIVKKFLYFVRLEFMNKFIDYGGRVGVIKGYLFNSIYFSLEILRR